MNPAPNSELEVLADLSALSLRVADWILELAIAKKGVFSIVLSGGSTPEGLYRRLAGPPYREVFPWARSHFFWGDERFVPRDDTRSNYRMAQEALLARVPVPIDNVHRIPTEEIGPEAAASAYERDLKSFYGAEKLDPARPLFDVVLLGLGEDGHTASLLPSEPVLEETRRWVAAVPHGRAETRITMTYPAIESSLHVAFLVAGKGKAVTLDTIRKGGSNLPAARVKPVGDLVWFVDEAAAGDG